MPNYREILDRYDIRPRRRFGQNFLVDTGYLDAIVDAAGLAGEETVVEIGAGTGNLTSRLAAKAGRVIAVEFDRDMLRALRGEIVSDNVDIIEQDALKADYREILEGAKGKAVVVANLPYNIATEIVFRLLDVHGLFSKMLLMTQLEVARRITANVGTKDYGVLAVLTNLWAKTAMALTVPAGAFRPKPKVDSAVIGFEMLDEPRVKIGDEDVFRKVVRTAFGQRRKTLANSLAANPFGMDREAVRGWLDGCGISAQRRAETLTMEEFAALANSVNR